ncbi:MAG TPA: ATP-binding domain-containing protein [Pleomorphomonadaceae bacterium]|nr:ATP-binding domain-containing protein [Pleomorphomonadaceae bacterium]
MTLSQGSLENLDGLTLLRGADVAVDLHRRLARRVTQQLLGDPRMDARSDQQARCSMAEVVESHPGQPGASQERLEMLGQPRPIDRVARSVTNTRPLVGASCGRIATIHRYKGLESPVVVLAEIDGRVADEELAALVYVGTTRARGHLVVVASDALARQL